MPVLNIAVIGSQDLLRSMGKLSDTRDIESYVYKEGTGTVSYTHLTLPTSHLV